MTKIQYPIKEEKESCGYTKVKVPPCEIHCAEKRKAGRIEFVSKKELRCSLLKTLLTVAAASLFGTAVIVVCYRYYQGEKPFCGVVNVEQNLNVNITAPQCSGITQDFRSDCWPQGVGVNQQACVAKGCCWSPASSDNLKGVPWCYYPKNPAGYSVQSSKQTSTGMSYTLTRSIQSGWPSDINTVQLDVIYETQNRLHFKFTDPAKKRYEVPIPVAKGPGHKPSSMDYQVQVPSSGPFSLKVTRKSTGKVLFSTENAAPLIFADQFLQLGTVLSSNFIYGLGEHRASFLKDTNWKRFNMWARDQPPSVGANLYGDHPFYLNIEDDKDKNAHGVFLLNSNALEVEIQPSPALAYRTIGGILDFYIFTGPTSDKVVQQYTELIGRPFMPPLWSLGFHLCRWDYGGTAGLKKVIQRMRSANMPFDTQWDDIDYMRQHLDWTYDSSGQFAGLPAVVDDLHAKGQHYIMIVDPGISSVQAPGSYPPYDDGVKRGIFIKKPDGSGPIIGVVWPGETAFPDFFHPDATDYWTQSAASYYKSVKFDGVWVDMNEPSNFDEGSTTGCPSNNIENPPFVPQGLYDGKLRAKTLCASSIQNISLHYDLHSLYGYSETVATLSAMKTLRPGKRTLIISRSTYPNSGAHGGHWLGDNNARWEDLKFSMPGTMNFQLYGIPMVGADICGFNGNTNQELCTRWMQLGVFYPFMRNHNTKGDTDQDPAAPMFDQNAQNIMREALKLRYSLVPFLYTLFYRSHVDGTAIVRPMFFQYPSSYNDASYIRDDQFMWGSALLITPAIQAGQTSRQGYSPKDRWYDFYDHTQEDSPGHFKTFQIPLDKINVQVRGGSIIPMQEPNITTTAQRKHPFKLFVALDTTGSAEGELYWDDGEDIGAPENGKYNLIHFGAGKDMIQSQITHSGYSAEPMTLSHVDVLGVDRQPASVQVNGQAYTKFTYTGKDMIQSQITHSGYSAEPMTLSHVDVLGVDRQPASVQVNGQAYTKFTYTGKTLTITGMSVNLLQTFTIGWKY